MDEEAVAEAKEQVKARKPRQKKETPVAAYVTPETRVITKESTVFDWKKFIPAEYIEISNSWYSSQGIDPRLATKEQREELKERAGEENLIIKLAGFKHLAHLRGLSGVDYNIRGVSPTYVSAVCELSFSEVTVKDENGEEFYFPRSRVSGAASATAENTSYPFSLFLDSMAENRSFIRAVKTAFNINILGAEELQAQAPVTTPNLLGDEGCTSPQDSLRLAVEGKGKGFQDLKQSLVKKSWDGAENWNDFSDIPSDQCLLIIDGIISKK